MGILVVFTLAIMKNAFMNINMPLLCQHIFSFLLGIYLQVELLGHMVTLCSNFGETARLFPK